MDSRDWIYPELYTLRICLGRTPNPALTSTNISALGIVDINNVRFDRRSDRCNNGVGDDGGSLEVMKIDRVADDNTARGRASHG